jgi:formate dehydrogenase major subunit
MPEMVKGLRHDLWWSPTRTRPPSQISNRGRHLPAADLPNFETVGSRTASNRSLQWGRIVEPIFESRNDYDVMYDSRRASASRERCSSIRRDGCRGRGTSCAEMNRGLWVDRLHRPVAGGA